MKTRLSVYKRKVYIPKDVNNFPTEGEIDAYIGTASIVLVFKSDPDLVVKDLEYVKGVVTHG